MMKYKETNLRFKEIIDDVDAILLSSKNIQTFPFLISKVIEENSDIVCRKYALAAAYGVDICDFGRTDAIIQKLDNKFIIFYNDDSSINIAKKKYSLARKFGHYRMNHDLNYKDSYELYEIEADICSSITHARTSN